MIHLLEQETILSCPIMLLKIISVSCILEKTQRSEVSENLKQNIDWFQYILWVLNRNWENRDEKLVFREKHRDTLLRKFRMVLTITNSKWNYNLHHQKHAVHCDEIYFTQYWSNSISHLIDLTKSNIRDCFSEVN